MLRVLLFFGLSAVPLMAIVTIKPVDVGEKEPGLSGNIVGAYQVDQGNTELAKSSIGGRLQWDNNFSVSFINGDYEFGEANDERTVHRGFVHARNVININKVFDSELFVQEQFNEFQSLQSRLLLGGGLRINIGEATNFGRGYLGVGAFYAFEKEENTPLIGFMRANIHLSYKYTYNERVEGAVILYYQPNIANYKDYLILSTGQIDVKLDKRLSLVFGINFNYNSDPAQGVKPYDLTNTTALRYQF